MARKTTRRGRTKVDQPISYLFEIADIDLRYGFSLAHPREGEGFYNEVLHVTAATTCLAPKVYAGRPATLELYGREGIAQDGPPNHPAGWRPLGVAHIEIQPDRVRFVVGLPPSTLWNVATAIQNGKVRFADGFGARIRRGTAVMTSFGLSTDYAPEDYAD